MKIEYCTICGQETGMGGLLDGSLYDHNGEGPYCDECFDALPHVTEGFLDAQKAEIRNLRKVVEAAKAVNKSREACRLAYNLFHDKGINGAYPTIVSFNYALENHQAIHAVLSDRLADALAELDGCNG
jgi:hypothetical protein